ncbi:hypothetical protein TREMEDRAFT_33907 [Tremella mesenterica DSM 1558]|uniref:uncharacterized protein n=1 Tax=Tremella mesenterica (strain ATCC 24925 / CBS 8224 / DSM 1558 / NBRC 9311 / NRRL Y-6157 / RJB 2259-6 / UBC 559-6) TaxID=578456 RepID=UPI0003F494F2|nr:uncharacterized protein TREMEDRAFT_33907 [Tremella mesenterica DSM 1558]EIW67159.1 hypothetical protein TREMEDRAFT_33907 [Tremella mesenterica DSM 1558]
MPIAVNTIPPLRPYVAPPETKADIEYCNLRTIDLSKVESSVESEREEVFNEFKRAISEDGFLYLVNFGLSQEQIDRQFAIAQHALIDGHMTDEEKKDLEWKYLNTGKYTGYKPRGYWDIAKGVKDNVESFNYYSETMCDGPHLPACLRPYIQDIVDFNHLHEYINKLLLKMLSKMLELPEDFLWNEVQSHNGPIGEGYFRQMMFHPTTAERNKAAGNVQMHGHQDYGITTLLLSQPIAALQVLGKDDKWRYVKYKPGGMVVNLGEVLEFISGGHLPATRHRVSGCPPDQSEYYRLTIGLFCAAKNDVSLAPLTQSPLLQREGYVNRFEPGTEGVVDATKVCLHVSD